MFNLNQIKLEQVESIPTLRMSGQFVGGEETDELREQLKKLVVESEKPVLVDLGKVTYLNSTALGVLISAHASFAKNEKKLALCNISDNIENIFVITKLTLVFDIHDSVEEAVTRLR